MTNPDELERLARAATEGPWSVDERLGPECVRGRYDDIVVMETERLCDAAFIAAANPTTILKLIAAARSAPPTSVEVFGSSAEGADTHRVAETAVVARPTGVRLEGRMDGPNPMMRVIIERADGTEYEAIQDNGTIISHWAHIP